MKNLQHLWDEVIQGENIISKERIGTNLRFPKGINFNEFVYSMLKVITTEVQPRLFFSEVYDGSEALITRREKTGDEIYAAHADVLNYLRGMYVKEHTG